MKWEENEDGLTLIELVVVVVVLGILTAIGFGAYGAIKKNAEQRAVDTAVSAFGKSIMTVRYDANWKHDAPFLVTPEEVSLYSKTNAPFLERLNSSIVVEDGVIVEVNPLDASGLIYFLRRGPYCTVGFFGNSELSEIFNSGQDLTALMDNGMSSDYDFRWAAFSVHPDRLGLVDHADFVDHCPDDVVG